MPTINMTATGQRIRALRLERGITIKYLQTVLGFGTPQAIYKWERGDTMPTLDNLIIVADVLGITIDQIVVVDRPSA